MWAEYLTFDILLYAKSVQKVITLLQLTYMNFMFISGTPHVYTNSLNPFINDIRLSLYTIKMYVSY